MLWFGNFVPDGEELCHLTSSLKRELKSCVLMSTYACRITMSGSTALLAVHFSYILQVTWGAARTWSLPRHPRQARGRA